MANSPAESPLKASNISEFVHKMSMAYKRRPASLARQFEQMQRISGESNLTDGDATSSGAGASKTPSRDRSTELDMEGYGGSIINISSSSSSRAVALASSSSPALLDPSLLAVKVRVLETLVNNIFSTVSSLKSSHAQLQDALTSCDPPKLETAEKAMYAEIRRLTDLKHSYLERDAIVSSQSIEHYSEDDDDPNPSHSIDQHYQQQEQQQQQQQLQQHQQMHPPKDVLLKSYEGIINNFHIEVRKKNAEVESLKDMLAESTLQKEKLEKRVKRLEQRLAKEVASINGAPSMPADDNSPTPQLLESAVQEAFEVFRSFTKLLISLMKAAQWDLDAACDSIEVGINYARRSHRKYAFESYVCQQMWNGFENDDFYIFGSLSSILDPDKHRRDCFDEYVDMKSIHPLELISVNPDCLFGKFCHKKFLQLVHPKMETSFFGNFEHRNQITEGRHPNSQFYQSFLRLAKAVWIVHRLAFAFDPPASIFQVRRGTRFSPACMESVVLGMELDENHLLGKVGFSILPGFRVGKAVIKCQVYVEASEARME